MRPPAAGSEDALQEPRVAPAHSQQEHRTPALQTAGTGFHQTPERAGGRASPEPPEREADLTATPKLRAQLSPPAVDPVSSAPPGAAPSRQACGEGTRRHGGRRRTSTEGGGPAWAAQLMRVDGQKDLRGISQEVGAADGLTLVTLFSEGFINFGAESEISVISLQKTNNTRKQLLTPGKTKFYVKKRQLTLLSKLLTAESNAYIIATTTGTESFNQRFDLTLVGRAGGRLGEGLPRPPRSSQ